MIIHKLILQHLKHRDDSDFYLLQALDAIQWMRKGGVEFDSSKKVLDLGCGHGIFGAELRKSGCDVVFADEMNVLMPELKSCTYKSVNIDKDNLSILGSYDVVVCSNVYEHLSKPAQFIESMLSLLKPGGFFYLSWTNWLSPWGGHEFSPFHFLGATRGHLIYDRLTKKQRIHTPFANLFPTYIGETLSMIRRQDGLRVIRIGPRYYPEFAFLTNIPVLREFLMWNCAILLQRT